ATDRSERGIPARGSVRGHVRLLLRQDADEQVTGERQLLHEAVVKLEALDAHRHLPRESFLRQGRLTHPLQGAAEIRHRLAAVLDRLRDEQGCGLDRRGRLGWIRYARRWTSARMRLVRWWHQMPGRRFRHAQNSLQSVSLPTAIAGVVLGIAPGFGMRAAIRALA